MAQAGELLGQMAQHEAGAIAVLDIGRVDDDLEQQPLRIHGDVAFASLHFFAAVVAARPPLCVVFTDWLSMLAALGVASRPARRRSASRS